MAQKVILDTDIGEDIDDALALGLILASPELDLLGVTTVRGNTLARARLARTLVQAAGRPEIPIAAGTGPAMSPRCTLPLDIRQEYLTGALPNQDGASWSEEKLPPLHPQHGVDWLIDTLLASDGDVTVVTIGAMTNLAMAIVKEPRIVAKIPRIVAMAGTFDRMMSEWNIRCDPVAAAIVLNSGIPARLVPLDVTMQVRFSEESIAALRAASTPLTAVLARSIELWQEHVSQWAGPKALPIMHDPLAALTMIDDSVVEWQRGTAAIELQGEITYGYTTFEPSADGPHEYAYRVDPERAVALYMSVFAAH